MRAAATPKLVTYITFTGGALFAALLFGRLEFLVLVLPMATALVSGLALSTKPQVTVALDVDTHRALEGERIAATIELCSHAAMEVEVAVALPSGLSTGGPPAHRMLVLAPEVPRELEITLEATRWGAQVLGPVALRVAGAGRLLTYEDAIELRRTIRVYPAITPMRKQIDPPETQVYSGNYVSRASGDGIEFSDVREFTRGDSPRRVNWRVTTRRQRLHVDEFHPERNADVVLFLDTFADVGPPGATSLDLAVRGAATLARNYLQRKDRIGLVAFGGLLAWITATSGQPHLYRIVDYLIGLEATLSYARKDIGYLPRRSLPPRALVLAFSPLVDERALKAFGDLHARGYGLIVIDTLPEQAVVAGPTEEDRVAHRAWKLARAAQRFDLMSIGVPVIPWSGEDGVGSVAARLPSLRRMPRGMSRTRRA